MKKLFAILMFVSTAAFAQFEQSLDVTPVLATVDGYQNGINQVALLADGRLMVKMNAGPVLRTELSKVVLAKLRQEVIDLSEVEVKDTHRTIICKMMVRPTLSDLSVATYDLEKDQYGPRRLILTAHSCAISHVVVPVQAEDLLLATQLREELNVLALNLLK